MLKKFLEKLSQSSYNKEINKLRVVVDQINRLEEEYQKLSEEELKAKTPYFKELIVRELVPFEEEVARAKALYDEADLAGELERKKELSMVLSDKKQALLAREQEVLNTILPEAFAVAKNACRRLMGKKHIVRGHELEWYMIPFDVQLIGGMILHQGKISEMKTGEGKTLVATLPLYLNALTGKGVHLVTVNDYLAQRDAEWMGFLFQYLGLSVGVVINGMGEEQKREAYAADITYGTNNEYGFDYLRDNMASAPGGEVQRELNYAIVDEVDSILIDEARTPLIISAPAEESTSKYLRYSSYVGQLVKDEHYLVDEKMKTATLTDVGIKRMEELLGVENIYTQTGFAEVHHIEQALRAQACYHRDIEYIIKDGEILIVDEFTGRVLPGRRYSDGLHQAIEAKENVEVKRESRTLATITFQNYFRLFRKLAGMTGTASTEAEEFAKIYKLEVLPVPTHRDMVRDDKPDTIYKTEEAKFNAIVERIKEKHEKGQPVLVGTIAIEKSEYISQLLKRKGVPHHVLNAKYHEQEAEIVAAAGEKGAVTIATNMAGRGTDIKLGEGVVEVGGLAIFGSERHESRRIDNQLRGRSGRQGDPGESQFFISLEDNLMRIFGGDRIKGMMEFLKMPEDMPIENKMISGGIESAQRRVEGHHFDMRKHVVEYDDVMNKHREIIYSRRRKVLHQKNIRSDIMEILHHFVAHTVALIGFQGTLSEEDEALVLKEITTMMDPKGLDMEELRNVSLPEQLQDILFNYLHAAYEAREKSLPDPNFMREVERGVYLRTLDVLWMEHLDHMQALREAVSLQGYGQKDPLVEYKREGYQAFEKLLASIDQGTLQTLFHLEFKPKEAENLLIQERPKSMLTNKEEIENAIVGDANFKEEKPTVVKTKGTVKAEPTVGRNDPCPCGAKKEDGTPVKYKNCHGKEV